MRILPKPLRFEWDRGNIGKNFKKHGISDKESEEVFGNKPLLISLDKRHSTKKEIRYHALGRTDGNKVLFLSFTVRQSRLRIISSRLASRKERKAYVQK